RLARPGAGDVAVDPGDGAGGAQPAQRERARQQWPEAGGAKPRAARRHLTSRGLRDSLEPIFLERGPPPSRVAVITSTIPLCLNLDQQIHHTASKLCILCFELPK